MLGSANLTIVNQTRGTIPRLPMLELKRTVLGSLYALDVIFVPPSESRRLNSTYRNKNAAANVLSFPLSRTQGQIVICPALARREAHRYGETPAGFIGFLFIHGLLHLKGHRHGSTMESEEKRLRSRFLDY